MSKVAKIWTVLVDDYEDWHSNFHSMGDDTVAHCCSCGPRLYEDDKEIIIDNRYPEWGSEVIYEVWEGEGGVRVIIIDDDSNTISYTPDCQLLEDLGLKLVKVNYDE